jgi:chromosome partitioning protein
VPAAHPTAILGAESAPSPQSGARVVAVVSNKGGVGKTTVATNLAVYLSALHEELPVALVTLDDQSIVERMFRLAPAAPGAGNLKHGWSERSFTRVLELGQYGIQFVPPPPDTGPLKARAQDPRTLARILAATDFAGVFVLDTKSDLEELTQNALFAADLVILPVADQASFEEAEKAFVLMERDGGKKDRGRVLLTLVDRRTKIDEAGRDLEQRLRDAVEARGWPRFQTVLSRSPRVEALNSGTRTPLSILHHARGTAIHRELRELAEEVGKILDLGEPDVAPAPARPAPSRSLVNELRGALLRGLRGR